jgi:hypothetical protein
MDDLGGRFWLWLVGCLIAGAIACFIIFFIFSKLVLAWGFVAATIVLIGGGLLVLRFFDRRATRRREAGY